MSSNRHKLHQWAEQGHIPYDKLQLALIKTQVTPDASRWLLFINQLMLWAGAISLASGIVFFFAFNWQELSRFTKFAILELLVLAPCLVYLRLDPNTLIAKMTVLFASIMLGVLMAFYGQTYQAGADPWQLFAYWALLISPWVIVARFAALSLLWLSLINVTLLLYLDLHPMVFNVWFISDMGIWLVLFLLNGFFLIAWEKLARYETSHSSRWPPRLLAFISGSCLTSLTCFYILELNEESAHVIATYPLWLFLMYYSYRKRHKDMFMLTGIAVSLIAVVTTLLIIILLDKLDALISGFFIIAIVILLMTAKLTQTLKRIHQEETL